MTEIFFNIFKKFPRSARLGAMFRKMTIPKKGKYVYMVGKLNVFPLRKLGGATAREPKREDATRAGDGAVARAGGQVAASWLARRPIAKFCGTLYGLWSLTSSKEANMKFSVKTITVNTYFLGSEHV